MKYFFVILSVFLSNFLFLFSPFFNIDNLLYDISMILSLPYKSDFEFAIVGIDEESLRSIGRWPWKREVIAQIIKNILDEKPRILCIDIGFFEKSEKDEVIVKALNSDTPVILPIFLTKENPPKLHIPPKDFIHQNVFLGHLHILIEKDGVVRKIPSYIRFNDKAYPSFSVQAAKKLNHRRKIPDEINIFYQLPEPFYFLSALKVLERKDLNLNNKIVFLGGTSEGLWDSYITPISSSYQLTPGVFIQAHALRTILSNKCIKILNNIVKIIFSFLSILIFIILREKFAIILNLIFLPLILFLISYTLINLNFWICPSIFIFSIFIYQSMEWIYIFAKSRIILREERKKLNQILWTLPFKFIKEEKKKKSLVDEIIEAKEAIENLRSAFNAILENLSLTFYVINEKGEIKYLSKEEKKLPKIGPFFEQMSFLTSIPLEELKKEIPLSINIFNKIYLYMQKRLQNGSIVLLVDITEKELKEKFFEAIVFTLMHDLKAPLNIMEGLFENICKKLDDQPTENAKIIKNQIKRIKDLISQYDLFMKLRNNKYVQQKEKINIKKFLEEILEELSPKAKQKNLEIKMLFEGENEFFNTDRILFYRIVTNILFNSLKFTPAGGKILIRGNINEELRISIEDSGPGVKEEEMEYLCEPFFRTKELKNIEGLGLGLSFVKEALKILNGKINFSKSNLGGLKVEISIK